MARIEVLKLSHMISEYGEDVVKQKFAEYESFRGPQIDDFLSKNAIPMEKREQCRTYIAVNLDDSRIIGFFQLAIRCIGIPDNCRVSNKFLKKLNRSQDNIAQAYLIGQLSRAKGYEGLGKVLLNDAITKIREANDIVGCRLIRIDCIDELIPYYEESDFYFVKKSGDNELNQMVRVIRIDSVALSFSKRDYIGNGATRHIQYGFGP